MGGKHNKCCCGSTAPGDLYVAFDYRVTGISAPVARVWKYDGESGTPNSQIFSGTARVGGMACSRDGYIYLGHGDHLLKLDSSGSTIWDIATVGLGNPMTGVAVGQNGYVYACGSNRINRYNTSDGSAASTPGGSGYGVILNNFTFKCICIDQSDNLWGGGSFSSTPAIVPVPSSPAVYGSIRTYAVDLAPLLEFSSININEANGELVATHSINSSTKKTIFTIDPTNLASFTSIAHGGPCYSSAYAPNGNQYAGGNVNSGGFSVRENGATFYSTTQRAVALVCGGDNSVFVTTFRPTVAPNYSVMRVGSWGVDAGTQYTPIAMDISTGRIGAFGNV